MGTLGFDSYITPSFPMFLNSTSFNSEGGWRGAGAYWSFYSTCIYIKVSPSPPLSLRCRGVRKDEDLFKPLGLFKSL